MVVPALGGVWVIVRAVANFVGRPAIETAARGQSLELHSTDHRIDRVPGGGGEDQRVRVRSDLSNAFVRVGHRFATPETHARVRRSRASSLKHRTRVAYAHRTREPDERSAPIAGVRSDLVDGSSREDLAALAGVQNVDPLRRRTCDPESRCAHRAGVVADSVAPVFPGRLTVADGRHHPRRRRTA